MGTGGTTGGGAAVGALAGLLEMTVILEGAGFFAGCVVLLKVFVAPCLGIVAGVELVETVTGAAQDDEVAVEEEEEELEETEGFPAVAVVTTGAEFTSTGSVEGMGFPSLV